MNITHPWAIIHQENGEGPIITALFGPKEATHKEFALVAADLIRHVARFKNTTEKEVMRLVQKELKNPTSKIYPND